MGEPLGFPFLTRTWSHHETENRVTYTMVSNVEQCKAASDELVAASQYVEELVARKARVKKVETAFKRCKVLMETYYSKHATVLKALQPGEDENKTVHEQRFKDTMEAYDAAEAKLKDYSQAANPKAGSETESSVCAAAPSNKDRDGTTPQNLGQEDVNATVKTSSSKRSGSRSMSSSKLAAQKQVEELERQHKAAEEIAALEAEQQRVALEAEQQRVALEAEQQRVAFEAAQTKAALEAEQQKAALALKQAKEKERPVVERKFEGIVPAYSIPREKSVGKVLKIRLKTCFFCARARK